MIFLLHLETLILETGKSAQVFQREMGVKGDSESTMSTSAE